MPAPVRMTILLSGDMDGIKSETGRERKSEDLSLNRSDTPSASFALDRSKLFLSAKERGTSRPRG